MRARSGGTPLFLLIGVVILAGFVGEVEGDATFSLWINKYYYLIKTSWGTPSQDMYLALDTGSQDLWAYGGMCYVISKTCSLGTNNYYRKVNSTTYSARSGSYVANYTTIYQWNGTVTMGVGNDQFAINSYSLGTMNFGLVNKADWSMYKKVNMSGVLGLGLYSLTGINGYLSTLLGLGSNGVKNVTLWTDRNSSTGSLTIGAWPTSKCSSNWTYSSVGYMYMPNPSTTTASYNYSSSYSYVRRYWMISLSGFSFGNYTPSYLYSSYAIFSTMVSYMMVPDYIFAQIRPRVKQVVYDYSYAHNLVDCNEIHKYPNMSFTIQGRVFNVTPSQYIWKTPSKYCILKIQPSGNYYRFVFGYPFHQGHCEQYNFNSSILGLAPRL